MLHIYLNYFNWKHTYTFIPRLCAEWVKDRDSEIQKPELKSWLGNLPRPLSNRTFSTSISSFERGRDWQWWLHRLVRVTWVDSMENVYVVSTRHLLVVRVVCIFPVVCFCRNHSYNTPSTSSTWSFFQMEQRHEHMQLVCSDSPRLLQGLFPVFLHICVTQWHTRAGQCLLPVPGQTIKGSIV